MGGPASARKGDLPPLASVRDDPVIMALGVLHGIDFEAMIAGGPGGRQIKIAPLDHPERQASLPDALPSLSVGLAGGNYSGQVIVEFGGDAYRYQRSTGRATVRIPAGALPETLMSALPGTDVSKVVDIPGLEGWTIAHTAFDPITESTVATLEPPGWTPSRPTRQRACQQHFQDGKAHSDSLQ